MTNLGKIIACAIGVAVLVLVFIFGRSTAVDPMIAGAIGTNPIENYIPAIKYNEGYYSELPVQTTSGFTSSGTDTFTGSDTFTSLTAASSTATGSKVGQLGTRGTLVLSGTCSLVSDASIAATSTGTGTCATVGTLAGDRVFVSLSTTTTKMAAQYSIVGTVAGTDSTTVRLLNLTGATAVPSATNGLGSSTQYYVYR